MSKISLRSIDKLIEEKCSSLEIDFLLYLARISDDFGRVNFLYYKDVCLDLRMSYQSFYNVLFGLQGKGLIDIDKVNTWGTWNITIVENIHTNEDHYKTNPYLNTNRYGAILFSNEFKTLGVNIKYLILRLLKTPAGTHAVKVSLETLKRYAVVGSIYIVKEYLAIISKWFNINLRGEIYAITVKEDFNAPRAVSEKDFYLTHKIKTYCKAYKVNYTIKDLKDLIILFKQYGETKLNRLLNAISDVCIRYRSIEPKLINKIVSSK